MIFQSPGSDRSPNYFGLLHSPTQKISSHAVSEHIALRAGRRVHGWLPELQLEGAGEKPLSWFLMMGLSLRSWTRDGEGAHSVVRFNNLSSPHSEWRHTWFSGAAVLGPWGCLFLWVSISTMALHSYFSQVQKKEGVLLVVWWKHNASLGPV